MWAVLAVGAAHGSVVGVLLTGIPAFAIIGGLAGFWSTLVGGSLVHNLGRRHG